ncbi:MAG: hypothetical protein D6693_03760 [Planctomycetota bacterium]|nr:MAG: hypothetical protein D6693_03760 [Planctomycetota bacterium]
MNPTGRTLLLLGALMVAALVSGAALWWIRRRLLRQQGGARATGPALTLGEIRAMRDRGDIDEQEFQNLRAAALAAWGAGDARPEDRPETRDRSPDG